MMMMNALLQFIYVLLILFLQNEAKVIRARAYLYKAVDKPSSESLQPIGIIDFVDLSNGHISVNGTINGLSPGQHGFHIHQFGDLAQFCAATGQHFHPNPSKAEENGDDTEEGNGHHEHAACLGNILAKANGVANVHIHGKKLPLNGPSSIIGRGVVVHEEGDQQMENGGGGGGGGMMMGSSKPVGCGVIAIKIEGNGGGGGGHAEHAHHHHHVEEKETEE